jgi:saccharopine dehydrogenase (NADP+, L-glutamate forming)
MKKILVLGAGAVVKPFLHYLFEYTDFHVKVASLAFSKPVKSLLLQHQRGEMVSLDVEDSQNLRALISDAETAVVASFVPPVFETRIAGMCIEEKKAMVATSYATEEMLGLDRKAREAGTIIIGEIGLDPGLDHMIAMSCISKIQRKGGEVIGFSSNCGSLPAPEDSLNPFGYKFSWHPRGALGAANRPARYIKNGKEIAIDSDRILEAYSLKRIENLGWFESYPNMSCLPYVHRYGIPSVKTIYRGTLRYMGWSETLKCLVRLGLLDEEVRNDFVGYTYRKLVGELINNLDDNELETNLSAHLGINKNSMVMKRLEWLGLLSDERVPSNAISAFDLLLSRMQEKLGYEDGERDMIVLQDEIVARSYDGHSREEMTLTLVEYGTPSGDFAIARTVGLPAAIATKLIAQDEINLKGVHIPVDPAIYEPVLAELAKQGMTFQEKVRRLDD